MSLEQRDWMPVDCHSECNCWAAEYSIFCNYSRHELMTEIVVWFFRHSNGLVLNTKSTWVAPRELSANTRELNAPKNNKWWSKLPDICCVYPPVTSAGVHSFHIVRQAVAKWPFLRFIYLCFCFSWNQIQCLSPYPCILPTNGSTL